MSYGKPSVLDCTEGQIFPERKGPQKAAKEQNSMENGRTTKLYHERLLYLQTSIFRVIIINFCLLIVYYEFDFINNDGRYDEIVKVILYLICACAMLAVPMTIFREMALMELDYHQKNVFKIQITASTVLKISTQILILLLQPYHFINDSYFPTMSYIDQARFNFKYNYLLILFGMLKLFIAFRCHVNQTVYMNPRSSRLSKMYLCKADYQFALKCMFKDYPSQLIGSAFLISIVLFSFALRVCQRDLMKIPDLLRKQQFQYMSNSVWLTIITMTTVGYGDIYPRTVLGRIVCILLVIWGIFVVSIMVVVLTNTFQMDQRELKVLSLMKKLQKKQVLREQATMMIQHVFRQSRKCKSQGLTCEQTQESQRMYRKLKTDFCSTYKQIKSICQEDDVYQEMARQFHCLDDDLKSLNNNQQKLIDFIHEKFERNEVQR